MGVDPNIITIDQGCIRAHLLACVQCRDLKEFPAMKKPRTLSSKRVSVEKKVKLFCVCRMPYSPVMRTLKTRWHSVVDVKTGITSTALRFPISFLIIKTWTGYVRHVVCKCTLFTLPIIINYNNYY